MAAVQVRDAVKSYVKGTSVLNHMDMTVPKGTIYGLLGSSGCGKTSILSCIVGLKNLDSGKILVFGKKPGSEGSGIPGRVVGYMPQEIALYPNFTIREILLYFGRIYGMAKSDVLKREEFLTGFLQLPDSSKRISSLSGGQQRRTSLATAFVHDPELLILDEPTVGVDPILRKSIWDHLCKMTDKGRTTVIVTTHYIEEARRSHTIGLMRNGRLLAENSPANLLKMFNAPLLEDIVLELCRKDHERIKQNCVIDEEAKAQTISINESLNSENLYPRPVSRIFTGQRTILPFANSKSYKTTDSVADSQNHNCVVIGFGNSNEQVCKEVRLESGQTTPTSMRRSEGFKNISRRHRIHSLIRRNAIYFMRNLWFLIMLLVFPALQTTIVSTTIGGDPKNMSIAVINEELPDWKEACNSENLTCYSGKYSCRFLKRLQTDNLKLESFWSKEEALIATNQGELYGMITIPENYTQHVIDRNLAGNFALNDSLDGTAIRINLDYSNYIASLLITRQLYRSLETYGMELGGDCKKNPKEFQIPLGYRPPVYGNLENSYTEYVVPGALMMILFLIPMCTCGLGFVSDKTQGTMDRSRVAGVTTLEMMVAFFVTDGLMIIFQTLISTAIIVFGFDFHIEGSYVLYFALCLLIGLCGQSWGFVLGIICPDEASLLLTGFTLHFPMLVGGGILWPLEAIPKYIRYISHCSPVTAALLSIRSVVARGVGLTNPSVWPGFVILCVWIVLAWSVAVIKYKTMKK